MSGIFEKIKEWLLQEGATYTSLRALTQHWVHQMRESGLPIDRINLGVFTIHPEMAGYAVAWDTSMTEAVEISVRREDTLTPTYLQSPIKVLVEERCELSFNLRNKNDAAAFDVFKDYQAKGYTHYHGFPISYEDTGIAALTLCTKSEQGFALETLQGLRTVFPVLKLLLGVLETRRLAKTVLRTYLGRETGERVLAGEIVRGQGEFIDAALWLCDLRDFTTMTETIGSENMIDVMNTYFDCMAKAVWSEGGEILKFMGDAMLVVFRKNDQATTAQVAQKALNAAHNAQKNLQALSVQRAAKGLVPLRAGIAVHLGQVIYGNVGAASRLDFTVMGHAVNVVARIQQLSGELSVPVLFSHQVAKQLTSACSSLGRYQLKGVRAEVEVFQLASKDDDVP